MPEPNSDRDTDLALDALPSTDESAEAIADIDVTADTPEGQPAEEATDDELMVETPDTEGLSEQPEEEAAEETTSEEGTEEAQYENDAEFLKAQGVEGHETVEGYIGSNKSEFSEFMEVAKQALGYEGKPANLKEFTADLMDFMMKGKEGAPAEGDEQKSEEVSPALDIDSFFNKYDHLPGDEKPFYQDFANMVSAASQKGQAEVQSQLSRVTTQSDMLLDMTWYNEAARSAGDDAIPSFAEARQLLSNSGDVRAQAVFRLEKNFGNVTNPYLQTFKTWAAAKTPSGLTRAETKQRDTNAKKVAGYKSLLKPSPATRKTTVPFGSLDQSQRETVLENVEG